LRQPVADSPTPIFQAGAAKVDITPPPGYPLAGHSIAAKVGRGYWTRLYARAIYLEDETGKGMLMVSCDLWSMPGGLADKAAELLQRSTNGSHLGRGQMVFAATHTHQGLGNFSTCNAYNALASPQEKFDRALFDFLAHRIAEAAQQAISNKAEAHLYYGSTLVTNLCRNRSFDAFVLDPEARGILQENAGLQFAITRPEYTADDYRAVDPRLRVISVRNNANQTIAIAAFLAVHATAMSHETEVYDSDLFGVAATQTEQALGGSAVVALFNGAEGDISPNWDIQDRTTAMSLGTLVSTQIAAANSAAKPFSGRIQNEYHVARLAGRCFKDIHGLRRQTDSRSVPGKGQFGGAEDGRTFLYDLGWKEGVTGPRTGLQGDKYPALDFRLGRSGIELTRVVESFLHAPADIPVSVFKLGPYAMATVPFEPTLVVGHRIAAAVAQNTKVDADSVIVIGLANEYVSYLTTAEEYEMQDYEGASTLYGPASHALVEMELAKAADALNHPPVVERGRPFHYSPGGEETFGVHNLGSPPFDWDDGLSNVLEGRDRLPVRAVDVEQTQIIDAAHCPGFRWVEQYTPSLKEGQHAETRVTPSVVIEIENQPGRWAPLSHGGASEDDKGLNFVTMLLDAQRGDLKWCCFWLRPGSVPIGAMYRFRVGLLSGKTVVSKPFKFK
jgi:neutral ceramidase